MDDTKPYAITPEEAKEIASLDWLREMWGETEEAFVDRFGIDIYAVKFHFHSGSPGYVGDYFIIQGDTLGERPIQLIRDANKKLQEINP